MKSLRRLFVGLLTFGVGLVVPVAQVQAASPIGVSTTAMSGTYGLGGVIPVLVCFPGDTTIINGGDVANIKVILNARGSGIDFSGTAIGLGGGMTTNCLVFNYTVTAGDTAYPLGGGTLLTATALTLINSATITSSGTALSAPSTALNFPGLSTATDLTAPTLASANPADGGSNVATNANIVLNFSEPVYNSLSVSEKTCSGGTVTLRTRADHGLSVGNSVRVLMTDPNMDSAPNSTLTVTAVVGTRQFSYAAAGCTAPQGGAAGVYVASSGTVIPYRVVSVVADADITKAPTNRELTSNVATLTFTNHGYVVGDTVRVSGMTGDSNVFNGVHEITAKTNDTFSFSKTTGNVASAAPDGSPAVIRVLEAISLSDPRVVFQGSTVTINPDAVMAGAGAYHVRIDAGAIRDVAGNAYAGITNATALNFATAAAAPQVNNITSITANSSYKVGSSVSIQVRFNEAVTVAGGSPTISLNSGAGAVATYASGSGTHTLTFTYTVAPTDSTLQSGGACKCLNVSGNITLSGATIVGAVSSTNAVLTTPGGIAGALNTNKAIIIDNTAPMIDTRMPFPGAIGVSRDQQILLRVNETVTAVANKKIYIKTVIPHVAKVISNAALTSYVATITTSAAHGLLAGNTVVIAGMTGVNAAAFNGTHLVVSAPTTTTITFAKTNTPDVSSGAANGTVTRSIWETINVVLSGGGQNIAVTSDQFGSTVVVTRVGKASTVNLVTDPPTGYYIETEVGLLTDVATNDLAAITGSEFWSFTASPDETAPLFNFAGSNPHNGYTIFPINQNIQIRFSESVSTVANKTIRLCTGDAGCATPVETFTLPSASVTSVSGGIAFEINPTANLLPNTNYFILIDVGAFADAAVNATASAVTAGQYGFGTFAPVGGGGGGGGGVIVPVIGCGPPPNPPCPPQINFGQGGYISNPGQIGAGNMATLLPSQFGGFRPDDARSLGNEAMQNFNRSQFGALPPSAMNGFNSNQISNLNPAAMAGMNRDQFAALPTNAMAGFRPDQIAQLPPSAMQGFDKARMGAMTPSAISGFNSNQMSQLPPSAMQGFDNSRMAALPPEAISGFNSDQMRNMPTSAMTGFNANQFAQLPPEAMHAFDPNRMKSLPAQAMGGFNSNQMAQLSDDVFRVFDPSRMSQLPPEAMKGMDDDKFRALPPTAMQGFNANQMAQLPPAALEAMRYSQMGQLPPAAMQGFKPEQFAALPVTAMRAFSSDQFAQLPPTAMKGMEADQFKALPPTAIGAFTPQQMAFVPAQVFQSISPTQFKAMSPEMIAKLSPAQREAIPTGAFNPQQLQQPATAGNIGGMVGAMNAWNMSNVPANAFAGMKPTDVSKLSAEAFSGMSANQFTALPPTAFSTMKPSQIGSLPPEAMANFKPAQMSQMPANAFSSFTPAQMSAMPANAFSAMKPAQMGQMPADAFESMKPAQMSQMPANAFAGMKPDQIGTLPPEAMAGFKPAQMSQMPANAFAGFTPAQMSAMPANAFSAMKPAQMGQMPADAFESMKPAQMSAMASSAFAGMKPDQIGAMPADAMAGFKPAQVSKMPANTFGSMKPDQVAALPPTALTGLKPAQVDQMPKAMFESLKATQVAALPPTALKSLSAEQMGSLPAEAMSSIKPTQVGALPPSAVAAIKPEQVDSMPAAAFTQMKPTQLGALATDAVKSLDATQINALPSEAFKGVTPTQAAQLTREQALQIKAPDLAQMKPAARAIVNELKE